MSSAFVILGQTRSDNIFYNSLMSSFTQITHVEVNNNITTLYHNAGGNGYLYSMVIPDSVIYMYHHVWHSNINNNTYIVFKEFNTNISAPVGVGGADQITNNNKIFFNNSSNVFIGKYRMIGTPAQINSAFKNYIQGNLSTSSSNLQISTISISDFTISPTNYTNTSTTGTITLRFSRPGMLQNEIETYLSVDSNIGTISQLTTNNGITWTGTFTPEPAYISNCSINFIYNRYGTSLNQTSNIFSVNTIPPPILNLFTITPSTITLETTSATIDMAFNFAITSSEISSSLSINPSGAGTIDTGSITNTSGTNWTAIFTPASNVDFPSCSITFSNSTYNLNKTANFSVNTINLIIENIELQPSNLIVDVSAVLEIQFSGPQIYEPIITIDPSNVAYIDGSLLSYNNNTIWRGILTRNNGINSLNNVLHVSAGDISGQINFDVIDDTDVFDVISKVPDVSVNESEIIIKDLSDNNLLTSGTQEENKIKRKNFMIQLLKNNKSLLQETDKKLIMKTSQLLGNNDVITKENIKILDNYDSDGNELNKIIFDVNSLKPNEASYAPLINVENSIIISIDSSKIKIHKKSETTYDITEDYIDDTTLVTKTMNEFDTDTYKNLIYMLGSLSFQLTFSMTLSTNTINNETSSILTIMLETSLPSDTNLNDYITITPSYIASLDTLILQPDGYTWKATLTKTPLVNNYNNTLALNYTPTGVSGEVTFDAVNNDVTYWEKVNDASLNATYDSDFTSKLVMSSDGLIAALGNANNNEVKIYQKNLNIWTLKQTLTDSSYFGSNIAIDNTGENIAISNTNNDYYQQDQSGTFVKVYKLNTTTNLWEQKGSTLPSSSILGFGKSISINDSGNILAIGVPNSGHVEIYEYEYSTDSWSQKGTNIVPGISVIHFGNSVSLSGNGLRVSIGALNNLKQNFSNIMLYEWNNDSNNWIQMGNNLSFFT